MPKLPRLKTDYFAQSLLLGAILAIFSSFDLLSLTAGNPGKSVLAKEIIKGCPRAEVVESYETHTYLVYICQTAAGDLFYRGVNKKNGDQINIMEVLSTDGGTYYATNGRYTYWIDRKQLKITKNDRVIFSETVWQ